MKSSLKSSFLIAVPLMFALASSPAEAKLIEVWGSGLVGGGYGQGDSYKDFYSWASGGAVGLEVGVKILFIGGFIDYLRWYGGDAGANLLTFNLGGDWEFGITDSLSFIFRLAFGYYFGTLPDDATKVQEGIPVRAVNTRGIGVHGGPGLRYSFLKIFSIGVTPELGYHYFFGGADDPALEDNSQGFDFVMLGYFRVGLGI